MPDNQGLPPHHEPASFGNPDQPAEGSVNITDRPSSGRMMGSRNPVIESQFPSQMDPPATDVSTRPCF